MYRSEAEGFLESDAPPEIPHGVDRRNLQTHEHGAGPLFHRRYRARILAAELSKEALIDRVSRDPDRAAPSEFATFQKVRGEKGTMRVGDEFVVRMPGPWDGPVRVVEMTPSSFRLATLTGHLEAGQIEFRAAGEVGSIVFTVESWARSGDRLCELLYDRLRMAKEIQLHMWTSFIERVIDIAGGRRAGGVEIRTRRIPLNE